MLPAANNYGYVDHNSTELVPSGKQYFEKLLQLINEARHTVHLQCYIFSDDATGQMVADALMEAARKKVKVWLMADGYASQKLNTAFINNLESAGVQFRFFNPLFKSAWFYFGRRLHHKIAVADGSVALVGGINISDNYNDTAAKKAWLDFALLVKGPVVKDICVVCSKTWNDFNPMGKSLNCDSYVQNNTPGSSLVKLCRNDWVRRKNDISKAYIEMLLHATAQVTILSSYFLPGKNIRRQMLQAAKRGVRVKVIAAGRSDVLVSKHAERWLYDWLLRNNIELYEYKSNILHGKLAVCDDQLLTLGSYNINNISAYATIECNLNVKDAPFIQTVHTQLEQIIANDCEKITSEQLVKSRNVFIRFTRWISYQFVRLLIYLFTFYFKHKP